MVNIILINLPFKKSNPVRTHCKGPRRSRREVLREKKTACSGSQPLTRDKSQGNLKQSELAFVCRRTIMRQTWNESFGLTTVVRDAISVTDTTVAAGEQ